MVNKVTKQQAVWVFLFFSAGQNDDVFGQIALFQALFWLFRVLARVLIKIQFSLSVFFISFDYISNWPQTFILCNFTLVELQYPPWISVSFLFWSLTLDLCKLIIKLLIFSNFTHVFKWIKSLKFNSFFKKVVGYEFLQFNP